MAAMMRHWVYLTTLVLATSTCTDERPTEASPAASTPDASARESGGANGGGFFLQLRKEPPPPPPHHEGVEAGGEGDGASPRREEAQPSPSHGLGGLAREMIEAARRSGGDPLRLVPDAAQYVARVRPAVLLAYAEVGDAWAQAEAADHSIEIASSVARACLGRLEAIDDVVVGFDDAEHVVLVARAPGLGTEAVWTCLRTETIARGRPFDLSITGKPRGAGPQLEASRTVGWFHDDDTVVLASQQWDVDVLARMRDEGTAAVEGSLAGTMKRVEVDDPLWLAGRITGIPESALAGTAMAGIDDVTLALRVVGEDLSVSLSFDAGEAADATHVRDEIHRQLDPYRSALSLLGVPATGSKLAFVADGDLVKLELVLTRDELRSLRERIAGSF